MTKFTQLKFQGRNAFVFCTRDDGAEFWLNFDLQPSGDVLVEARTGLGLLSCYENVAMRERALNNRMYGKRDELPLTEAEVGMVAGISDKLRFNNTGDWDAKYAPGADFAGEDFFPVDGLGDFK